MTAPAEARPDGDDQGVPLRRTTTFAKDVVDRSKETSYLRNRDCEADNRFQLGSEALFLQGELVVVGQISHGFNFEPYKSSIGLRVELSVVFPGTEADNEDSGEQWLGKCRKLGWMPIRTQTMRSEQTQTCYPDDSRHLIGTSVYVWNHPLDLYLAFNSIGSWPMLKLLIYAVDDTGDPERKSQARVSLREDRHLTLAGTIGLSVVRFVAASNKSLASIVSTVQQ
ncbi:hypothetical protein FOZ60_017564 [Perkinsus olseni]|uniref:Uncharacterized protein n=1 Tax=Perkinsus olseni TaxID=32597 RepID=A0A7J6PES2_PEROL|nr:hypothetical protein FOZ60_017564 [Perkinsus olseni]